MTSFTPNYSLPYPALTDSPNGAAQIQALASAADTAVLGVANKKRIEYSAVPSGNVACLANNYTTVATITIPDPGWAYYVKVNGQLYYSSTTGIAPFVYITLDSTVGSAGCIIGGFATSSGTDVPVSLTPYKYPTSQTGSHVIRLMVDSTAAGTCMASIAAIANTTWLNVEVIPV